MYIEEIKDWIKKNGYNAEKIGNITFDIHLRHGRQVDMNLYDALEKRGRACVVALTLID